MSSLTNFGEYGANCRQACINNTVNNRTQLGLITFERDKKNIDLILKHPDIFLDYGMFISPDNSSVPYTLTDVVKIMKKYKGNFNAPIVDENDNQTLRYTTVQLGKHLGYTQRDLANLIVIGCGGARVANLNELIKWVDANKGAKDKPLIYNILEDGRLLSVYNGYVLDSCCFENGFYPKFEKPFVIGLY